MFSKRGWPSNNAMYNLVTSPLSLQVCGPKSKSSPRDMLLCRPLRASPNQAAVAAQSNSVHWTPHHLHRSELLKEIVVPKMGTSSMNGKPV